MVTLSEKVLRSVCEVEGDKISWDRTTAEDFLIHLQDVFNAAGARGEISGVAESTGVVGSGPLEVRVEVIKPVFSFSKGYLDRVPDGEDPARYSSEDPSYRPERDSVSNYSALFGGLSKVEGVTGVESSGDQSSGPSITATLDDGRTIQFVFGSGQPGLD